MRILLKFTPSLQFIDIHNIHIVNNYVYAKCLKYNKFIHDAKSDYSISPLYGGVFNKSNNALQFPNGAYVIVTSQNQKIIGDIIKGTMQNEHLTKDMFFDECEFVSEKFLDGWNYFSTLSPFIIKEYLSKKEYKFCIMKDDVFLQNASDKTKQRIKVFNDVEFSNIVTEHTKNKLYKIKKHLQLDDFKIEIKNHHKHKVKAILKKHGDVNKKPIVNFANQCQINMFCNKDVAEIVYNVGMGQSNGSGFGTICKTENFKKYQLNNNRN